MRRPPLPDPPDPLASVVGCLLLAAALCAWCWAVYSLAAEVLALVWR